MNTTIELPKEGFKPIVQYGNQPVYAFHFDVEETDSDTVICSEVTFALNKATYESMVAKCIGVKYNTDAQLALLYNYQANSEEYAELMEIYQTWRTYCKDSAREFFGENIETNE